MDGEGVGRFKKYLFTALLGGAAAAVGMFVSGIVAAATPAEVTGTVCDGLFAAAVLLLGGGGLAYVSNEGGFDLLPYGVFLTARAMTPWRFNKKFGSYAEYIKYRRSRKLEYLHILIVGGVYLLLALTALGIYNALM